MSTQQTTRARKPGFPVAAVLALVALIVVIVAMSFLGQGNVSTAVEHDHNQDGKPDHAAGAGH